MADNGTDVSAFLSLAIPGRLGQARLPGGRFSALTLYFFFLLQAFNWIPGPSHPSCLKAVFVGAGGWCLLLCHLAYIAPK